MADQDMAVVEHAVEHGAGDDLVAEDVAYCVMGWLVVMSMLRRSYRRLTS